MEWCSVITQDRLKELLHYEPLTGIFTRLVKTNRNVRVGEVAGTVRKTGYKQLHLDGKVYRAHRLAFLYMTGDIPDVIDHINRLRDDNSWDNLRAASSYINNCNACSNNTFVGVHRADAKYRAYAFGQHIGTYATHIGACYTRWQWELDNKI